VALRSRKTLPLASIWVNTRCFVRIVLFFMCRVVSCFVFVLFVFALFLVCTMLPVSLDSIHSWLICYIIPQTKYSPKQLRQNLQFRIIIYILRQMIHDVYISVRGNRMDNQEWIESKDTGNIVHTRNRAKTNKTKTKHDTTRQVNIWSVE
jgi:hypothetical protein